MSAGPAMRVVGDRWELAPNPAGAVAGGRPACHDRTPFLTILCTCGYGMHLHESQLEAIPADAELETRCHRCRKVLVLPVALVRDGMRQAWGA